MDNPAVEGLTGQHEFDPRINALAKMTTNRQLKEEVTLLLAAQGFSRWLYASSNPYGKIGFPVMLANEFGNWMMEYMMKGYAKVDPIVLHCRTSNEPLLWDAGTGWENAEPKVRQLMCDIQSKGFGSGVAIPLGGPDIGMPQGMFNVTAPTPLSESRDQFNKLLPRLVTIGQALHQAMDSILRENVRIHGELV